MLPFFFCWRIGFFGLLLSCQVLASACRNVVVSQIETTQLDPYFFESRPDILSPRVKSQPHNLVSKIHDWAKIQKASYWMAAEVLALYPNEHLVFLARDASIIYDVARLLTHATLDQKRIHILSISQGSNSKKELKFYLQSHGITEALMAGQGLVLIDSGYRGSVLYRFRELFPQSAGKIQGHMIHPKPTLYRRVRTSAMSYSAFEILNPGVLGSTNINHYSGVGSFENLPQSTSRTTDYEFLDGVWKARSLNVPDDFEIESAHAWQQQLKWQYGSKSAQERFLKIVREIRAVIKNPSYRSSDPEVQSRLPLLRKTAQDIENLTKYGDADHSPISPPDWR
jgi:hypothetical protein